jgi:hypothetical protein
MLLLREIQQLNELKPLENRTEASRYEYFRRRSLMQSQPYEGL